MSGERLVGGAYRLGASIGRGGMGEVYEATGPDGEAVAVKIGLEDAEAIEEGAVA